MTAAPLPLSLMPGPASTESRWAPTTTTLFGSPFGESAITFVVLRVSEKVEVVRWTCTGPALVAAYSSAPVGEVEADHRDGAGGPERPGEGFVAARLALVEDGNRGVAGILGVLCLHREVAGPALDQGHLRQCGRGGNEVTGSQPDVELGAGVGGMTMSLVGTSGR